VTATSVANTSLKATASVSVSPVASISVTPSTASVTAGGSVQLSATVTGESNTAVTWSLSGVGSTSSSGLYTAPSSLSSGTSVTVTATSVANSSLIASASITISPASSSLLGTAVTSCGQSLSPNASYYLANDIGSDPTVQCLTPTGPGMVLNLNGHKITGTMKASNMDTNGVHIYNGSVTCQDDDPSRPGCIYISSGSTSFSAILEIDHLALLNKSATSSNSERNLMIDFGSLSSNSVSGPNVKIHDNSSVSATGISSSRIVNLQVQGTAHSNAAYVEFYNNATLCQSTAAACQGIVAYGLWNTKVHNNTLVNQLSDPNSTETPRAVICDQTDGCEIYANTIDAQDGRAVRLRGTNNKNDVNSVHDNTINNVVAGTNGNHVAAFHIGDPDSGSEVENATIYNNTINAVDGWVFMARSATAITIRDNTLNGSGSLSLLDARSLGAPTQVYIMRTTVPSGTADSFCESGVSATVCKSGAASGSCSISSGC
jgi:hypothetical protein